MVFTRISLVFLWKGKRTYQQIAEAEVRTCLKDLPVDLFGKLGLHRFGCVTVGEYGEIRPLGEPADALCVVAVFVG